MRRRGLDDARALVDGFVDYWDRHRAVLRTRNLAAQEGDERFRDVRHRTLRPFMAQPHRQDRRVASRRAGSSTRCRRRRRARRWSRSIERMAAFHRELEELDISRADLVETTARIIHQTVVGRATAGAAGPVRRDDRDGELGEQRLDLARRAHRRAAQLLVRRVRREQRERVDRVVGRPVRAQLTRRDETPDEAAEVLVVDAAGGRRRAR